MAPIIADIDIVPLGSLSFIGSLLQSEKEYAPAVIPFDIFAISGISEFKNLLMLGS